MKTFEQPFKNILILFFYDACGGTHVPRERPRGAFLLVGVCLLPNGDNYFVRLGGATFFQHENIPGKL